MSNPFIVSAIEFLFVPVNIDNMGPSQHQAEIISLFGESQMDYPVNLYPDPNVDPSPSNNLADRLHNEMNITVHMNNMNTAHNAFYGYESQYFAEPHVVVVKPRKKTLYLGSGETNVEFEVSPYQGSGHSYSWFIDGEEQPGTDSSFSASASIRFSSDLNSSASISAV